jgi:hypothetical protein
LVKAKGLLLLLNLSVKIDELIELAIFYTFIWRTEMMKFARIAVPFALMGTLIFGIPNVAQAQNNQKGINQGGNQGNVRGAPGPIVGAGLPILVVGCGVYWLMKRRRKTG